MMKYLFFTSLILLQLLFITPKGFCGDGMTVTGIKMPADYRSWQAVAPSHRTDKGHLRQMLANPIMATAYKAGAKVFPEGSSIVKLVYKAVTSPTWTGAQVPGEPVSIEFMVKDSKKYPRNKGWGLGTFSPAGKPVGDAKMYESCFPCHDARATKDLDYVFTRWAP
jgi:hypothetical protein